MIGNENGELMATSDEAQPVDTGGENTQRPESTPAQPPIPVAGKIVDNLPGEFAGLAQTPPEMTPHLVMSRLGASFILQQETLIRNLQRERESLNEKLGESQEENKGLAVALAEATTSLSNEREGRALRAMATVAGGLLIGVGQQSWANDRGLSVFLMLLGLGLFFCGFIGMKGKGAK